MKFAELSGLLVITIVTLCEEDVQVDGKPVKSEGMNDLPIETDGWMLHTPGGGPLDSRCPCLPFDICPRAFGHSPMDVLLLGHLPICKDETKVRCCGASLSIINGFESAEVNDTRTGKGKTVEHISSSKNVTLGDSNESHSHKINILPKESSSDLEGITDITEMTEESPTTFNTLQDMEHQTERNMHDTHSDDAVNVASSTYENGTDTLTNLNLSLNQSEDSDMVYIENLRPDVLLFQDAKGFIQETEGSSVMVVTPIPLTPRAKYQQQLSTGGNSQLPTESDPSYIHTKDVMYITHRPEGEVMVITPLSVESEKLITQLSLPPGVESSLKLNLPSQEEQPEVHYHFSPREVPGDITDMEGFSADIWQVLPSKMLLEETREKHPNDNDWKPISMENPIVIDSTSVKGQGPNTTIIRSNSGEVSKEIHPESFVDVKQKFTNDQVNVETGFGLSETTVRNSKRPAKTRIVTRPTWSPKRISTRKPENLGATHSPQQGSHLDGRKNFLGTVDGQYLSSINKPILTHATMAQDNRNINPNWKDLPSTTSVKYIPVPVNKIDKLKLQPILTSPAQVMIPNTLGDQKHILMARQALSFHRVVNPKNEAGIPSVMNKDYFQRGLDSEEILRRKQDMGSLHHKLSSFRTSLRQSLVNNAEEAQPNRMNHENPPAESSNAKIEHHSYQQFYTQDNPHIYKPHDDIFGRKIITNQ